MKPIPETYRGGLAGGKGPYGLPIIRCPKCNDTGVLTAPNVVAHASVIDQNCPTHVYVYRDFCELSDEYFSQVPPFDH